MKRIAKRTISFPKELFEFSFYICSHGLLISIYAIKFIETVNRNLKKKKIKNI